MTKAQFQKEAVKKYEKMIANTTQLSDDWKSEMNFIFSEDTILRVWWNLDDNTISHRWCSVQSLPHQKDEKLFEKIGLFLSNDEEEYPEILSALRKAKKAKKTGYIDHIRIGNDGGTIDPVDKFEFSLTVKDFCDMIGLES